MKFKETDIEDCFEIEPLKSKDRCGQLVKCYHAEIFRDAGIDLDINEEYFSISKKNVLRGLHFQVPPNTQAKLVTCIQGEVFDVVVDLRKDSPSYLKQFDVRLSCKQGNMLFVPEGLAHGFCVQSDYAIMLYMCSDLYSIQNDSGIKWDSLEIPWPVRDPIISDKDCSLMEFSEFENPF